MRKSVLFLISIALFSYSFNAVAQQVPAHQLSWQKIFDLPTSIPVPNWVKHTDWDHPNVYTIDEQIKKEGFSPEEGDSKNELNEEPYREAYIRWRNQVSPFIQPDGSLVIDSNYYQRKLEEAIQAQDNTARSAQMRPNGTSSWSILGPVQMWYPGNGGKACYEANIYSFAITPGNTSILYAGSETGAIFKSTDKGQNWHCISDALPAASTTAIGVSAIDSNTILFYGNSMVRSKDGGNTWSVLSAYTGGSCNQIVFNPISNRIIVAGNTGVYYSDDTGTHWTLATGSNPGSNVYDVALNPLNPATVFAVGRTAATSNLIAIMISYDGGSTFTNVSSGLSGVYSSGARLAVTPADTNYVYCATLDLVAPKVLKSINGGSAWSVSVSSSTTGLSGANISTGLGMSNGQGFYDMVALASPSDKNTLIVATTSAYKSIDGGLNFAPVGGYVGSLAIHPDMQFAAVSGNDAYITTDGGVNYSSDFFSTAANWSIRNNGLTGSDFWGFDQGWDQDLVVGGRYHNGNVALFENYASGAGLRMGGGESPTGYVFHGTPNTVGCDDIGTYVIPNSFASNMVNADVANTLWPSNDYYGTFTAKLIIDPRYSNIIYVTKDSTIWKSTNKGASYTSLHKFNSKAWRFSIARSNPAIIYLCATQGIFKSTDTGNTWTQLTIPVTYQYYNTDICVNPSNENEVYFCMAQGASANKVFKSVNGGSSWTNYTGAVVAGKAVAFLAYQGGTNGGIYAITNAKPTQVFYRDNSMSDWINFSNGLPQNFTAGEGGLIFYRDSKLRIAGNRGVWESPLYSQGAPVAQPMADKQLVSCSKDTVSFMDYSMDDYSNSACTWSFPGASFVSCTSCRAPKVLYPGPGNYSVTLTVMDSLLNSSTRTINNMIVFDTDRCAADTVAGKSLVMNGTSTTVPLGKVNINSNTFSISCWFKPYGNQSSFSQLISHGTYGQSSTGFGMGFIFNGYTPNLKLCYSDSMVGYSNNSGLIADSTRWNNVVLTYSSTGVKMYLNGIAATVNNNAMPVIDLSKSSFYVNLDAQNGQGSKYKGEIDEIKFYNYTLSQDEVRAKMHLIQKPALAETGLLKYFQFNQYNAGSGSVYDLVTGYNSAIAPTFITTSTAPVATGVSYKSATVNAGGQYSFTGTGMDLFFKNGAIYPNGNLVGFRLNSGPDQPADARPAVPSGGYFIINNYGTNSTFTAPDSIRFSNLSINNAAAHTANQFKLFKRPSNSFGNTWGTELDSADAFQVNSSTNGNLTFSTGNGVTSFSQFIIADNLQTALPIADPLLNFIAIPEQNFIGLNWLAGSEKQTTGYKLERSLNGIDFRSIVMLRSNYPAGTQQYYQYQDRDVVPDQAYYYRVQSIHADGSSSYSMVRKVILSGSLTCNIYPNPSHGYCYVDLGGLSKDAHVQMLVFDITGKCVFQAGQDISAGKYTQVMLNLQSLPEGDYVLQVYLGKDLVQSKKFVMRKD